MVKPRGGTDTSNASQNLGVFLTDFPKYILTCLFRKWIEALAMGKSCASISIPSEFLTTTCSLATCSKEWHERVWKEATIYNGFGNTIWHYVLLVYNNTNIVKYSSVKLNWSSNEEKALMKQTYFAFIF